MAETSGGGGRRRFLKQVGMAGVAAFPLRAGWAEVGPVVHSLEGGWVRNRTPLAANAFYPLRLGSVRPTRWLLRQLKVQADGLGGHLDETWADVGAQSGWLGGRGESWERGPYFLDGLLPLAYLLDDAGLKAKAQRFVEWTLGSQRADGMFGPASNDDWWPRMVMLKALTQYEEVSGDTRVVPFLSRYFAYQLASLPARPLRDWGRFRWQDNVLTVLWVYNRTGEARLLELAALLRRQGHDWQGQYADFKYTERITREFIKLNEGQGLGDTALATHGVNNGQALKAAPVWSMVTGAAADRGGIQQMLAALDRYHGLPNGMFSCDEHFAGRNPSQGSELCTVVESMFSLEQSLAILGDARLGDRLEMLAFNALPGTFTDDMWAHQYNQEPNQVEVSLHTKPWTTDGPESNLFGLEPNYGCCTANFHQGWPKFAASLWMGSDDGGLVAAAYSPCELETVVAGVRVSIKEETGYPFEGEIRMTVVPARPLRFPLRVRLPGWAAGAVLSVNGRAERAPEVGGFAKMERTWSAGDVVTLKLPMEPRWVEGFRNSVSVQRGPVVFSLGVGESWVKLRERGMTADWQVFPGTAWNYGVIREGGIVERASVVGADKAPFTRRGSPLSLLVQGRKLPSWRAVDGVAEMVPESPVKSAEATERLTLIPYAAAKLRITAFPFLVD